MKKLMIFYTLLVKDPIMNDNADWVDKDACCLCLLEIPEGIKPTIIMFTLPNLAPIRSNISLAKWVWAQLYNVTGEYCHDTRLIRMYIWDVRAKHNNFRHNPAKVT